MRLSVLALVAPLVLVTGCGDGSTGPTAQSVASAEPSTWVLYEASPSTGSADPGQLAPGEAGPPSVVAAGTFLPYRPGSTAITYDPAVVPPGARVRLVVTTTSYGMVVRLTAAGMIPRRAYGAHLHRKPCTGVPDEAGPHYQHHNDPGTPAVDP